MIAAFLCIAFQSPPINLALRSSMPALAKAAQSVPIRLFQHGDVQVMGVLPRNFKVHSKMEEMVKSEWTALLTLKSNHEMLELMWAENAPAKNLQAWKDGFSTFKGISYTEVRAIDFDSMSGRIVRFQHKMPKGVHLPEVSAKSYMANRGRIFSTDYYSDSGKAFSMDELVQILKSIRFVSATKGKRR